MPDSARLSPPSEPPRKVRGPAKNGASRLTTEERLMWLRRHREAIKAVEGRERMKLTKSLRGEVEATTADEVARLKGELQAEWNALPPKRQETLRQRFAPGPMRLFEEAPERGLGSL